MFCDSQTALDSMSNVKFEALKEDPLAAVKALNQGWKALTLEGESPYVKRANRELQRFEAYKNWKTPREGWDAHVERLQNPDNPEK